MPTTKDVGEEIVFVRNLKSLVSTYEEIAVMRIEKVRETVLKARQFREGLSHVFTDVKTSQARQIAELLAKKKEKGEAKNNREVVVYLSTNTRLAGHVTSSVARAFVTHVDSHSDADIMILGQVGKELFLQLRPGRKFTFFPLSDGKTDMKELTPILQYLQQYEGVTIFFARFQNLIGQEPTSVDLGQKTVFEDAPTTKKKLLNIPISAEPGYIFEPSLEVIIDFFNKQIFAVLFQQTRNEAWLSLLGSRVTAMEQAAVNIKGRLKELEWEERRERRRIQNKKQRDRLAGITLWTT